MRNIFRYQYKEDNNKFWVHIDEVGQVAGKAFIVGLIIGFFIGGALGIF